jgi:hypothetical protein
VVIDSVVAKDYPRLDYQYFELAEQYTSDLFFSGTLDNLIEATMIPKWRQGGALQKDCNSSTRNDIMVRDKPFAGRFG